MEVTLTINGTTMVSEIDQGMTLADFLRDQKDLPEHSPRL